jgi:hypothetical protein
VLCPPSGRFVRASRVGFVPEFGISREFDLLVAFDATKSCKVEV